jgi:hypothetical protein
MTAPWEDRDYPRGTQYKTDANLAARRSIYAYQHPRIDLQAKEPGGQPGRATTPSQST